MASAPTTTDRYHTHHDVKQSNKPPNISSQDVLIKSSLCSILPTLQCRCKTDVIPNTSILSRQFCT
eukprot:scaffold19385_cov75-Cyclotella_meneghiniana.AAC.5